MADNFEQLGQFTLSDAAANPTDLLTGAAEGTIVRHIRVVNTGGADQTVTIWQGGASATGNNANLILPTATIDDGGWAEFEGTLIVDSGELVKAQAGAGGADLTITLYGLEMTP